MCNLSLPFAYFQHTDSVLPNSDGPLSTAVPVSTVKAVSTVEGKNPTLAFQCHVHWCGELGYLTVNPRKFSPQKKLFSSNSRKFSPTKETRYTVIAPEHLVVELKGGLPGVRHASVGDTTSYTVTCCLSISSTNCLVQNWLDRITTWHISMCGECAYCHTICSNFLCIQIYPIISTRK